tara:strand:- start:659 stop:862 length:204 start_codon:yes stop_codon:yes gene_type:complete
MSKLNRLNARRKVSNRPARTIYPPLTEEQKAEWEITKKSWDKSQKEAAQKAYDLAVAKKMFNSPIMW